MSRILLPVAVWAGFLSSAFGQSTLRDRDPDIAQARSVAAEVQNANFRIRSFYLDSRIRIADAGVSGDVNVPTGDQTGGIKLGIEAPQRLYYVPHRKTVFTIEAIPAYSFFGGLGDDGQFDYTVRGDAHFLWNHLYLDAYVLGLDKIRAHPSEINRLATTKETEGGIGGEWKYSSRTSAIFSLRTRDISYPDDRYQPGDKPVELLERTEQVARVALHHKTLPLTSFFVAAEAGDYVFDRTSFKDGTRRSIGGGFLFNSGRTNLRAEAGSTVFDFNDPNEADFDGLTWSATAARQNARWGISAGVARDIAFAVFLNNNYFESTTLNAQYTRRIGHSLTGRLNALLERDEFPHPVLGNLRRDDISFYSAGLIWNWRKLGIGSDVGWFERTSTYGGDEDSGIRWVLHLSLRL